MSNNDDNVLVNLLVPRPNLYIMRNGYNVLTLEQVINYSLIIKVRVFCDYFILFTKSMSI